MDHNSVLIELVEKTRKSVEQAEAYYVSSSDEPVRFEANSLKQIDLRESEGVALRVVKNGRIGFSSTTDLSDLDGLIESAIEVAPMGPEAWFVLPGKQEYPDVPTHDAKTLRLDIDTLIQTGQKLVDHVRTFNKELLCDVSVDRGVSQTSLLNTNGGSASYSQTVFSIGIQATLINDTDMLFIWEGESSSSPISDVDSMVNSIERKLEYSKNIVPAPVGRLPVVFTPNGVAGALVAPLLSGLNGKGVLQGSSPLVDKLGEEMLDDRITIWDKPKLPMTPGSRLCDDEGVPSVDLTLVDKGVVNQFMYDLQTAGQAGTESTGSAHRGLGAMPSPGASVLVFGTGGVSADDIISDIQSGLIVEGFLGAGQSNVMGGDFNANVLLGFRIEDGQITGRVKDTLISGNVYSALSDVRGISQESEWVGGMNVPLICCDGVSIATKG